ncbi:MAG: 50S ribosomal protein L2 [Candidatus Thermoplasmatota archaeon]|nr:50S ribosomal protein L2 [Candidatus Thermoplasmatota archaeon]
MGKRITPRRRGKGGLVYRSPSHRHIGKIENLSTGQYKVKDIVHAPGRNAPVMLLQDGNNKDHIALAFNGAFVGQDIVMDDPSRIDRGSTIELGQIPDGEYVYNIESFPGDGGKFCRTAGAAALIVGHGEQVSIKLPSGKLRLFSPMCKATVGRVAGSGLTTKPILKAGTHIHYLRSKAKRPYTVRGVAMNAINHPHGGGNHQHVGRPSTVGLGTPPGRKVGRLSPQRRNK